MRSFEPYLHSPAEIKQFCKECSSPKEVIRLLEKGKVMLQKAKQAHANSLNAEAFDAQDSDDEIQIPEPFVRTTSGFKFQASGPKTAVAQRIDISDQ